MDGYSSVHCEISKRAFAFRTGLTGAAISIPFCAACNMSRFCHFSSLRNFQYHEDRHRLRTSHVRFNAVGNPLQTHVHSSLIVTIIPGEHFQLNTRPTHLKLFTILPLFAAQRPLLSPPCRVEIPSLSSKQLLRRGAPLDVIRVHLGNANTTVVCC